MALFTFRAKSISRSQSQSVVAAAAYRHAAKLKDERLGITHDYSKKEGVVYSELSIPESAPQWAKDLGALHEKDPSSAAEKLWNLVEATEKRKDSQLARDIMLALPHELTAEQNIELARAYIASQFTRLGMIADWSVHFDAGNPHVHILLTYRELLETGFGQKVRAWNDKKLFEDWRAQWAEHANRHLFQHGFEARIDHRSYEERGIELIPTKHLGKAVMEMEQRGIETDRMREHREIQQENLARIEARPEILTEKLAKEGSTFTHAQIGNELGRYINPHDGRFSSAERDTGEGDAAPVITDQTLENFEAISGDSQVLPITPEDMGKILKTLEEHESVFSERDIARAVSKMGCHAEAFSSAVLQVVAHVKNSEQVLYLGAGDDGRDRFTTRALFECETELQAHIETIRDRGFARIPLKKSARLLQEFEKKTEKTLTEEQKNSILHLLKPKAISCVVGRAGTGKSFSLGAARHVWESSGFEVIGIATAGIAASGLEQSSGITSSTIQSFLYRLKEGHMKLTSKSVVVMDEAGMTDLYAMSGVMEAVQGAHAKLVLVGDPEQLQPVGPGAIFRALLERVGFSELTTVYRQKEAWAREATQAFAQGEIVAGLKAYEERGYIHLEKTDEDAISSLLADWKESVAQHALQDTLVLAHRNEDVELLNEEIREARIQSREIKSGVMLKTHDGTHAFSEGDRILFLKNDRRMGLSNGSFGTMGKILSTKEGEVLSFQVVLDDGQKVVEIDPIQYQHFTHGYAATVHKSQGKTVKNTFVYAGGWSWIRHLTYVAMSRHTDSCHLYGSEQTHGDLLKFKKSLSRASLKDSVIDFPLSFAERRGIRLPRVFNLLPAYAKERIQVAVDDLSDRYKAWYDPKGYLEKRERFAEEKLRAAVHQARREDARDVAAYVDARRAAGAAWGSFKTTLEDMGLEKMSYAPEHFEILKQTKTYATLEAAKRAKEASAYVLAQDLERYTHAIQLYDLEQEIKQDAKAHASHLAVSQYLTTSRAGKALIRDSLAFALQSDIKGHYVALKSQKVDLKALKEQALSQLKRKILLDTPKETRAEVGSIFERVARYRVLSKDVGVIWAQDPNAPLSYPLIQKLQSDTREREVLAHEIMQDLPAHDRALNFYHIGIAEPHFGGRPSELEIKAAEKRWYQLQARSARYAMKERVGLYRKALAKRDRDVRITLAHEIVQDIKGHHGAILSLQENPEALWREIRRDAKLYEYHTFYQTLTRKEKMIFNEVARYVEAKKAHASAWREILSGNDVSQKWDKKTETISPHKKPYEKLPLNEAQKILSDKLARFAKPYTDERNRLAACLLENPGMYVEGFDHFKIDVGELKPQAERAYAEARVSSYLQAKTVMERAQVAIDILACPKLHAGALIGREIDFKQVYQDARPLQRKEQFASMSKEDRTLHRLGERYRAANRWVGKRYGAFKSKAPNALDLKKSGEHLTLAFTKRDRAAFNLVLQARSMSTDTLKAFCEANRLAAEKIMREGRSFALKREPSTTKIHTLATREQANNPVTISPHEKTHTIKTEVLQYKIDVQRVNVDLNEQAEAVALHYLGEPKHRTGVALKYGSNQGSLVVTIRGSAQGLWNDFQGSGKKRGGNMFQLIGHALETEDFKTILKEATRFLGGESRYQTLSAHQVRAPKMRDDTDEREKKLKHVAQIVAGTRPIQGTVAERYLREQRAIQNDINIISFRYHPNLQNWVTKSTHPALVVLARDADEKVCGIQAIFLDPKTAQKAALDHNAKLSRGFIGEGACVHEAINRSTQPLQVAIAEGPETALSVAEAHPDWDVYVSFGVSNFEKTALKTRAQSVIICADNDGQDSGTENAVHAASQKLAAQGVKVFIAEPSPIEGQKKVDFNDVLKAKGVEQVRLDLDQMKSHQARAKQDLGVNDPEVHSEISYNHLNISNSKTQGEIMSAIDNTHEKQARTAWQENFPEVIVHTSVTQRNEHKDYAAAKNGDKEAAFRLANDLLHDDEIRKIEATLQGRKPIIACVSASEKGGINVIPEALAHILGRELNLEVDLDLIQSNYVNHTKNRAFHRMAYPAVFEGKVQPGRDYLLVDDHVGLGGTLANLKGYIEKNGGKVILTTTLTSSNNSQNLAPLPEQIQAIRQKHGKDLSDFLIKEVGHDIEQLTRAEAGQILSTKDVNEIRERFASARENRNERSLSKSPERKENKTHPEIHEKVEAVSLTPEKEEEYKNFLKHYQKLKAIAEESNHERDRAELRRYSHKLNEDGKRIMRYAQERYPAVHSNIQTFAKEHLAIDTLPPEKEKLFKDFLKHYQKLKEVAETHNQASDYTELLRYSNKLSEGKLLMRYAYKHYPSVYENIQTYSKKYITKDRSRGNDCDHDIDR